jgi:hypothetical protein
MAQDYSRWEDTVSGGRNSRDGLLIWIGRAKQLKQRRKNVAQQLHSDIKSIFSPPGSHSSFFQS